MLFCMMDHHNAAEAAKIMKWGPRRCGIVDRAGLAEAQKAAEPGSAGGRDRRFPRRGAFPGDSTRPWGQRPRRTPRSSHCGGGQ
jgi:hypothetical protein